MRYSVTLAVVLMSLLIPFDWCHQGEALAAGSVAANQAYLDNFGPPPAVEIGRALARVGYLPLRSDPGRVSALPFFLYDEKDQLRQIIGRLSGKDLILPPDSPLYQPAFDGVSIGVGAKTAAVVTLSITTERTLSAAEQAALFAMLTETAVQFPELNTVRILLNGKPAAGMPLEGFRHVPGRIVPVRPPTVLLIGGMWERGAAYSTELSVSFDRPVKVRNFALFKGNGEKVAGEYFISAFDMAVVVHPEHPRAYPEGTLLRAEWDIVDAKGRANHGVTELPLQRFEH